MNIHFATTNHERRVRIKVIGVGGAGGNAVDRMIENGLPDVDFYAVNTDRQALDGSRAHQTLVIGNDLTRGLGAGGDPEVGRQAAEEDRDLLAALVEDADMVFVTAGMGGGTGTGAAPLVAEAARASGALTVAVVTRPFDFEGTQRMEQAEAGLANLRQQVDALLVIPNERLMEIEVPDSGMTTVFQIADNVLYEATRGISDIIAQHAVVNLDFADVRTVMRGSGAAIMGTGRAAGENRATTAAQQAICSPLLESVDILGSRAVLVYLTAACVTREDLREAMSHVQQAAGSGAHIFFGFAQDESLGDDLRVTVIATGFPTLAAPAAPKDSFSDRAVVKTDDRAVVAEHADQSAVNAAECTDGNPSSELPAPEPPSGDEASRIEEPARGQAPPRICFAAVADHLEPFDEVGRAEENDRLERPEEQGLSAESDLSCDGHEPDASTVVPVAAAELADRAAPAVARMASMAAAAGSTMNPARPASEDGKDSFQSPQFLEPLGSMKLQDIQDESATTGLKFRKTEKVEDMLRPAWERKYVD